MPASAGGERWRPGLAPGRYWMRLHPGSEPEPARIDAEGRAQFIGDDAEFWQPWPVAWRILGPARWAP